MNLNEQTYRIKQMMGLLSEQTGQVKKSPTKAEILKTVNPDLQRIFSEIEKEVGMSLPLAWGERNKQQNAQAGGVKNSSHLRGLALDIHFETPQKELIKKLIKIASDKGILGMGVYNDGDVLHIDIDSNKGRRAWGSDTTPKSIQPWSKDAVNYHLKNTKK